MYFTGDDNDDDDDDMTMTMMVLMTMMMIFCLVSIMLVPVSAGTQRFKQARHRDGEVPSIGRSFTPDRFQFPDSAESVLSRCPVLLVRLRVAASSLAAVLFQSV